MTHIAKRLLSPRNRNDHKYFVQLYGERNNGKTSFMKIMEIAFPMCIKMPDVANLLARNNRSPHAPQPWLPQVKDARVMCFEEPPRGAKFDKSLLKLARGNGTMTGRSLYINVHSIHSSLHHLDRHELPG